MHTPSRRFSPRSAPSWSSVLSVAFGQYTSSEGLLLYAATSPPVKIAGKNATPLCVRPLASVVPVPPSCTCQLLNDCRSAPAGPAAAASAKHAAAPRPANVFICLLILTPLLQLC